MATLDERGGTGVSYGGTAARLEESGFLLHVVSLPQRQPVKLFNLHPKDVKERLRSQVALERAWDADKVEEGEQRKEES